MGRASVGLAAALVLAGVSASCPNACNQRGYCSGPGSDAYCICAPGFTGAGCESAHCPRGDDPLTTGQSTRSIRLTTLPAGEQPVDGLFRVSFMDASATMAAAGADNDDAACGRALSGLAGVERASCERGEIGPLGETSYVIRFHEWSSIPVDAAKPHYGNPPLASFACASTLPGDAWDVPQCVIEDVVAENVFEHVECSNHGTCDREKGACQCAYGWMDAACGDNTDSHVVETHEATGPFYSGSVLSLRAERTPSHDFAFLKAYASGGAVLEIKGTGDVEAQKVTAAEILNRGFLAQRNAAVFSSPRGNMALTIENSGGDLLRVGDDSLRVLKENGTVLVGPDGISAAGSIAGGGLRSTRGLDVAGDGVLSGGLRLGPLALAPEIDGVSDNAPPPPPGGLAVAGGATLRGTKDAAPLRVYGNESGTASLVSIAGAFGSSAELLTISSGGTELLAVSAGGAARILEGGLSVEAGGIAVRGGGLDVTAGGISVDGGITLRSGDLKLGGGLALDGGLRTATASTGEGPLVAAASSPAFLGAVATFEAPGARVAARPYAADSLRLLAGTVGGADVFSVDGAGALDAAGGLRTAGALDVGGAATFRGPTAFRRAAARAGPTVRVDAAATYVEISDDGATAGNVLTVAARAGDAARQLIVANGDADVAFLGGHSIPAKTTRVFYGNAAGGWGAVSTAVEAGDLSEITGVTKFEAAGDLDVGPHALRARSLSVAVGDREDGRVLFLGPKGALERDADLVYERAGSATADARRQKSGVLRVGRLAVTRGIDGPLDMGGHAISGARIERGSAVELSVVTSARLKIDGEAGDATQPPLGFERFALFGRAGEISARPEVYYYNDTLHARAIAGFRARGDVELDGFSLRNAAIRGGSLEGIARVSLDELQLLPRNGTTLSPPPGTLTVFGENGTLVSAWAPDAAEDAAPVAIGDALKVRSLIAAELGADVDARNFVVRNAQLEGGGAAGLEFVAADVVLVSTLDQPDVSKRGLVLAGAGGSLESAEGLYVDAANTLEVPAKLAVDGPIDARNDVFVGGSVVVSGTVMGSGAYIDSSDARFKTDLRPLRPERALDALGNVTAYAYKYKTEDFPDRHFNGDTDLGFLAQDVERVLPELVYEDAEGYKAVAYGRFAPVLAAAVSGLAAQNAALEARVADLEARLAALARVDERLAALEAALAK